MGTPHAVTNRGVDSLFVTPNRRLNKIDCGNHPYLLRHASLHKLGRRRKHGVRRVRKFRNFRQAPTLLSCHQSSPDGQALGRWSACGKFLVISLFAMAAFACRKLGGWPAVLRQFLYSWTAEMRRHLRGAASM